MLFLACDPGDKSKQKDWAEASLTKPASTGTLATKAQTPAHKPTVLVLPPYDDVANAGISPRIQKDIEDLISADTSLSLIAFPYKKLVHEPYSNVFDKKFCDGILKVIPCDVVIMSKVVYKKRTGRMNQDKWEFRIKIYDVRSGQQVLSKVAADSLTDAEIGPYIARSALLSEIKQER